ncbi:MAG: 4-(cytidine 5'-diphospho)-2-C-methyl-D-erythritol kinase, partial [Chloroflexi bacterium]|nr:4-(cytidine 5'-diphospho)-2-C-methyl-D-erythritol kinase [Chloroflexota bacterium]
AGCPQSNKGTLLESRLSITAYAKINLSLEVLGRRPDGYREVRTVMHTISLADHLTFAYAPDQDGALTLTCDRADLAGEGNLALRALRLLQAEDRRADGKGVRLHIKKGIPVAAGLGGGSTDAAAAFIGANRLWGLGRTAADLAPLAAQLGADVPFLLTGGCALASGRGDELEPLPPQAPPVWLVLLTPPVELENKTARMYGALTPDHYSRGEATAALAAALRAGARPDPSRFVNVFERVADQAFPVLAQYRRALLAAGAGAVRLSGAGPTLFAVAESEADGRAITGRLATAGYAGLLCHTTERAGECDPAADE